MPIEPGCIYTIHISYPTAVFEQKEKCSDFLLFFNNTLSPVLRLIAFCIKPNSAELLIRAEEEANVELVFKTSGLISKGFQTFEEPGGQLLLTSLLQNFVHKNLRNFHPDPKITTVLQPESNLMQGIRDIHFSPVRAGLCTDIISWTFSSYAAFISDKPTRLPRESVLALAGSKQAFIDFHQN